MKFLLVGLLAFLISCTHGQKTATAPLAKPRVVSTDERTQKDFTQLAYKDLSALMNITMLTVDGDEAGCKIPPDALPAVSQMLKGSIDERFAAEKENYLKKSEKQRGEFFPKDCVAECSCAVYASFFDNLHIDNVRLSKTEKKIEKKIFKDLETQSKNLHLCAEEQAWVCDSKAFQSLYSVE